MAAERLVELHHVQSEILVYLESEEQRRFTEAAAVLDIMGVALEVAQEEESHLELEVHHTLIIV